MKSLSYMTRALTARDPRFARILGKLGYDTTALTAQEAGGVGSGEGGAADIAKLRADYDAMFGKKPYHGWDAATLASKIEQKRSEA